MIWYAVYQSAGGVLVSVGTEVANPLPDGLASKELGESDTHPQGDWDTVNLVFTPFSTVPERWTKYEFLMRMTAAERIAIRSKATTDPVVEDFMHMLDISGDVVRSNPVVLQGLNYLVSVGCLDASRVGVILP